MENYVSYRDFLIKQSHYNLVEKIVGILHTFSISKSMKFLIIIEF